MRMSLHGTLRGHLLGTSSSKMGQEAEKLFTRSARHTQFMTRRLDIARDFPSWQLCSSCRFTHPFLPVQILAIPLVCAYVENARRTGLCCPCENNV